MKRYYIIFLSSFILSFFISYGQKMDYSFRHINTENGLSQNTVLSIMQDKKGFMWFGTKDGLNRYDGNSIKIFKHDDSNPLSLGNNTVWSLLEMSDGKIWVGTDRGIYVYNPLNNSFIKFNKKTRSNIEINGEVLDMEMDKSGCVWITSSNLFKYTISTGELEAIFNNNADNDPKTQPLSRAWSINVDNDNQVWISFHYGGIRKYNPSVKQIKKYQQDAMGKDLTSLLISKTINIDNDFLLIGSFNDGLRIMDKKNGNINTFPLGRNINQNLFVRDLGYFSDGNYWIGTESGLYIYNPTSRETTHLYHNINDRFSLSDNAVYSMYEDKEGGIWIGTYFGGINYFPLPFNHFEKHYPITNKNSISGERVSGICEDASGNIWIGTEDAGLNMLDIRTKQFRHYSPGASGLNYHNIHDIITDGNYLWIATFSRGINVLNLKTNTWKYYVKGTQPGMLDNNDIFSLFKDKWNNIWVGTSTGAFLFDRKSEKFIKQDYMQQHFVSDITEDALGQIWFATYINGVYCFNPRTKELKNYNYNPDDPTSICHYKITSMFLDSKNQLWFASESKGICMFDKAKEKFIRYSMKDGFSNNVIYKILEDNEKNLWLSSNLGLMIFNPETKQVRIFTKNNGLPGNQFNYKSGYKDKTGKMYFGSLNGLISFQPKQFIYNNHIPPVVITDFHLLNDNNSLSDNGSNLTVKKLKHTQSSFSISFSALSYVAPEMNKYAYKMEGLDSEWNYLSSPQQITYSNLKHGKYTFRVKASNNDGLWNEKGDLLEIIISPPFWQTTWAYVLYVIIIGATFFYIINYNKRKLENENKRKQRIFEIEKEKEIYNTKIEFFTNVAHEIRTPLTLIKGPLEYIINTDVPKEELQSNLLVMEKNTNRLLYLINQLLDFRKTESHGFSLTFVQSNINDLLSETYERFKPLANQKNLNFKISVPSETIYADVDREALIKILSNLLNNAVKYSESYIGVELKEKNDNFVVTVENDGEIIPEELSHQIFNAFFQINSKKAGSGIGLALVRSLVDLHSGDVYLDTSVKTRNIFVVSLPKKQQNVIEINHLNSTLAPVTEEINISKDKDTPSLLVVDDNEELLQFVVEKLAKQYVVFKAHNGEEALAILEKEMINLVISDIIMPQIDGFELCARIKENPEYSHIPVILLTAKTNIQSKITGLESGADAYIEKPFSMEHLLAQISNLLDNRKKIREAFNNSPFIHTGSIALTKSDEQFLNKLTDIILKNIANPVFHVDQLAEELCMSRSSLLRKIKGVSGSTPNDFIRLIRLKQAATILKEGEYKVNEVCFLVGFSSTSYFSKTFQKQFGVLPKDFIKNFKKKEEE